MDPTIREQAYIPLKRMLDWIASIRFDSANKPSMHSVADKTHRNDQLGAVFRNS